MTCIIGLTRMYYPNVTVISIRNLLLIIVCLKTCNHYYVICTDACTFDVCILIHWLIDSLIDWLVCLPDWEPVPLVVLSLWGKMHDNIERINPLIRPWVHPWWNTLRSLQDGFTCEHKALTTLSVLYEPIARALAHAAAAEDAVVKATVATETYSVQPPVRPGDRCTASPWQPT